MSRTILNKAPDRYAAQDVDGKGWVIFDMRQEVIVAKVEASFPPEYQEGIARSCAALANKVWRQCYKDGHDVGSKTTALLIQGTLKNILDRP